MDILIVGYVGIEGTIRIAHTHKHEILDRYPPSLLNAVEDMDYSIDFSDIKECASDIDIVALRVAEGGLYKALWDIWESEGRGFLVRLEDVPIRQETIELSELFDINPYTLSSDNCFLLISPNGNLLRERLVSKGYITKSIGLILDSKDKIIQYDDRQMYLTRPDTD